VEERLEAQQTFNSPGTRGNPCIRWLVTRRGHAFRTVLLTRKYPALVAVVADTNPDCLVAHPNGQVHTRYRTKRTEIITVLFWRADLLASLDFICSLAETNSQNYIKTLGSVMCDLLERSECYRGVQPSKSLSLPSKVRRNTHR